MQPGVYFNRLWNSDEEVQTSDEDLEYLRWELAEKKELQPQTMKLLRGIVQMPFKDRKNPGRYDHEGSDHDQEMLEDEDETGGKAKSKQVKPYSIFNNTSRMGNTALDRLRNMSKED